MNAEALYQDLLRHLKEGLFSKASTTTVYLAGLAIGGAWIAKRLAKDLNLPQYGVINVSFHRDDYAEKGVRALESANSMPTELKFDVNNAHIVLIDDVLFTGRTVRAALNELFDFGRPAQVSLMVLADRGERELPISADFVAQVVALPHSQILVLEQDVNAHFHFQIEERLN
ncbi:bifunctional pyr operon transcriptional regulator/uracil phosphoribosyltransferase PyrR [Polynucleobacter sp. HIN8]|uniref:bifunctional pyr operon transcriptional regulator/uracil phosphoribosyltransferase PyrR n=1 Tax=Polynucleobacter sp. HIN8 TaxID=3047867 RepID=UPI00257241AE|nr:bifunctional pyr operon transcriptional regulator/uracil phosphoribosyltransferase PyrR [Polynucleobacter sp. HIN8]BEI38292.1 bifunctional pyr operon transcriptional regulator/uracil phosphoribosyltransferase PyrR [Polynucleobacter sp. HIN8]